MDVKNCNLSKSSNNTMTALIESTMINMKHQNNDSQEYFLIKQQFNNSRYQTFFNNQAKTTCTLFDHPNENESSPFENIVMSYEDKSSVISLLLRTFNLWNDETFWTEKINLMEIMKHFATDNEANVKNMFSILLYDWHCPSDISKTYLLCAKVEKFEMFGLSMFSKLFQIIDDEKYAGYEQICMRIIYHILHEKSKSLNEQRVFIERSNFQDKIAIAVNDALNIKNDEFRLKVLKVLSIFLGNSQDKECQKAQERILEQVYDEFESKLVYKMPLEAIQKHCDGKFFRLAFLLKENRLKKFEAEFDEFLKIYRKFYGEYWKIAIKENLRLLYHTAEEQCEKELLKIVEFIFKRCPFIELNSTILTSFEEVACFYNVFNEPLDEKEEMFMDQIYDFFAKDFIRNDKDSTDEFIRKCIENKKLNQKLLFGRRSVKEKSLIEEIFSRPKLFNTFEVIWKKFELFEKLELLTLKNFMGKSLMHYAYEAGIHQIAAFLELPTKLKTRLFKKHKHYMMVQNSQAYSLTGKSLIGHYVDVCLQLVESDYDVDIFPRVVYLLEEIGKIEEVAADEFINYLIELMKKTDRFSCELFEIDVLMGFMVTYWKPSNGQYQNYKNILIEINPFFELLFMVIEKRKEEFNEMLLPKFVEIEEVYEARYDVSVLHNQDDSSDSLYELYSSNFMFILFLAAIRTDQMDIIDIIFDNDCFVTIRFGFPENIVPSDIHYYAASNLLKHGHELGQSKIPEDWLTQDVLRKDLNARISYHENGFIKIDFTSLLHAETKKIKVKGPSAVSDELLMLEDTLALEYIKEHEHLKILVTHPVIETYINLKSYKYHRIYVYNFWGFIILYVLPFASLITYNLSDRSDDIFSNILITDRWKYIGIVYLFVRELFQCIISESISAYYRQRSNIFDMILIVLAIALSIVSSFSCVSNSSVEVSQNIIGFLEVTLIFLTTISATSLLPLPYVPINMQILRKVSMTFLKVFKTFAIILIAFSFSFRIMFDDQLGSSNCTPNNTSIDGKPIEATDTLQSFKYPYASLIKIITMLSGEYSIEPSKLSYVQLAFFAVFLITSLVLFNLILGLSIEDVQELKKRSRQFNLLMKTKKLIRVGHKMREYYKYLKKFKCRDKNNDGRKEILKEFLVKHSISVVKFFLSKYIYVHSLQKIYIDTKTNEVFVNVNRKYEPILKINGYFKNDKYIITDETKAEIQQIINME